MDEFVKVKELEKLTNCKISDIQDLASGHTYIIGIDVGDMPKEHVTEVIRFFSNLFNDFGVKALIYPKRKDLAELTIYELEPNIKDISYMYENNK
ncbi:MAG: hypothetical protein IJH34_09640 [Romboutsia sp.]|nr:hypothetical protein [Romboutsia sp.]